MHAYRRFVQETMDSQRKRATDVERAGGPTRQVISRLLNDPRDVLDRRPDAATVAAFARGLNVPEERVLAAVAEAMGLPVQVRVAGLTEASNEQLLAEVHRRMGARNAERDEQHEDDDGRERGAAEVGGDDAGAGQKTGPGAGRSGEWDLAAHPVMPLAADRIDAEFDQMGEESQDHDGEGA